jgi:hypothetical protein
LSKFVKYLAVCLLIMLASTILIATANAQDEVAEVIIVYSVGGTVDPAPDTYYYDEGETITLTATPQDGFRFSHWVIQGLYEEGHNRPPANYPENAYVDPDYVPDLPSTSEIAEDSLTTSTNPLKIICGYGYTYMYQAVFVPVAGPSPGDNTVVIVLDAAGGTTDPGPGTYTYLPDETVSLSATADDGFEFQYWIATGVEEGHDAVLLDSSLDITCQTGYTYSYQPVFRPAASTVPSDGGVPAEYLYAIIVVLAIIAVIGIAAALMYRGKSK